MRSVKSLFRRYIPARIRGRIGSYLYLMQYYFDHIFTGTQIEQVLDASELRLPTGPIGTSRFPRRICKLCDELDWVGEDWLHYLDELGVGEMRERKHRKGWEWAQGLYALEKLGMLRGDAVALGVGAGTEQFVFYLTNHINKVYATDIYGQGKFANETAFTDMVTTPGRYSKIPFDRDHLVVMEMDGCDLKFSDDSFNFVFSFSSIEHFGGHERAQRAMKEMARVVKPYGAVVVTTEIVLNGVPHHEYFLPEQLLECCVYGTGLQLIEDIDFEISKETLSHVLDCRNPKYRTASPHIALKFGEVCWTSVSLVLEKKSNLTCEEMEV